MIYAYITGGGTKWIYDSLKNGGASQWFLGARIPYNQKDFDEILGGQPFDGKYVSERTAAQLSVAAYSQAVKMTNDEEGSTGLGVTAKLGTSGQRKGRENKVIITLTKMVSGQLQTYIFDHKFPSWMPRILQERSCSNLINNCLEGDSSMLIFSEKIFYRLEDLKIPFNDSIVLYSGSFNPIHESHFDIIKYSSESYKDYNLRLEIPTKNFSKGYIGPCEMSIRYHEIKNTPQVWNIPILFSKASTFVEKAKILKRNGFLNIIFPMGDDTYERITNKEKDELVELNAFILLFKRKRDTFIDDHPVICSLSKNLPKLTSHSSTEIRKNAIQK